MVFVLQNHEQKAGLYADIFLARVKNIWILLIFDVNRAKGQQVLLIVVHFWPRCYLREYLGHLRARNNLPRDAHFFPI